MIGRQLPASDYLVIKAAIRELISACGGPVKAAGYTRVSHQDLSRYGSVADEHADRFMPADVMADLEAQCGQPVLSRELAGLSNFLLVDVPSAALDGSTLDVVTADALKEISDVFVALGKARADRKISGADAASILPEITEALAKLVLLKLQVEAETEADNE